MKESTTKQTALPSHTPGPWSIGWSLGDYHRIFRTDEDETMGYIANIPDHAPTDGDMEAEAKANARLIAAAPDLLESAIKVNNILAALQHACDDGHGTYEDLYAMCKLMFSDGAAMSLCKAIAKARGQ